MTGRRGRRPRKKPPASSTSDAHVSNFFQSLISALQSQQGPSFPIVKSLYYLLVHCSLREPISRVNFNTGSNSLKMELIGNKINVDFKDICSLSNLLFRELDTRFKEFFSALHAVSASCPHEQSISNPHFQSPVEELTVLLRCCMVVLLFLISDQGFVVDKAQALLSILSRLISLEKSGGNENKSSVVAELVSPGHGCNDDGCDTCMSKNSVASVSSMKPSDFSRKLLCPVLEVFADELLVNKPVRQLILLTDSVSSRSEMLFNCHFGHGDVGSVLEVISAHFIVSLSDEQSFEKFVSRLYWQHENEPRATQMSLTAGLSLLLNPVMFSAPKIFQGYFILLVSDVIHISMSSENKNVDPMLIDFYLEAFERSVILYTRHMCNLQNDHPLSGKDTFIKSRIPESNPQLDFDSHLLPDTWKKICHLVTNCQESLRPYLCSGSLGVKSNLVTDSIAYVKESLRTFDMSCTDEMLSILSCIILRGSSDDIGENVLYTDGETSVQDIYLLASILKLMSCSIMQILCCLRHGNISISSEALKEESLHKEFDVMMDVIGCFERFSVTLPVQKFLLEIMEAHPSSHMNSKWMLLHFSGLLSLSFVSGIDFLVNDCIFAMISVLNIFIFEEGGLHALGSLVGSKSKSSVGSSGDVRVSKSFGKVRETFMMDQKSSHIVASKFVKIRTLYLGSQGRGHRAEAAGTSENTSFINCMDSAVGIHEETCSGRNFLKCIVGRGSLKSSEIDDLADFIECKQGKDYSGWLKGRQKFRKWWKHEKMAAHRWNKKRKAWRCMVGKK